MKETDAKISGVGCARLHLFGRARGSHAGGARCCRGLLVHVDRFIVIRRLTWGGKLNLSAWLFEFCAVLPANFTRMVQPEDFDQQTCITCSDDTTLRMWDPLEAVVESGSLCRARPSSMVVIPKHLSMTQCSKQVSTC